MRDSDFSRQIILEGFGDTGQRRLEDASILIIGAGGLGGIAATYLAAAGVGKLTIVDHDRVELSNLHRQIPFDYTNIGESKSIAVGDFALARTPCTSITPISKKLSEIELLDEFGNHDIVLDCADDSFLSYILSDCSLVTKKPVIFGNASRFDGQLFTMAPSIDGLEAPCWRCLWPPNDGTPPTCDILGVVGPVPGMIGSLQALEAIKYIVGYSICTKELIRYSFTKLRQTQFLVEKCPKCKHTLSEQEFRKRYLGDYIYRGCLKKAVNDGYTLLDIRDDCNGLTPTSKLPTSCVDMYDLLTNPLEYIKDSTNYIVLCRRGPRSQYVATSLREKGYKNVYAYTQSF